MRRRTKLAGAIAFVDQILETDKKAPRKQRHTARRIWWGFRGEGENRSGVKMNRIPGEGEQ